MSTALTDTPRSVLLFFSKERTFEEVRTELIRLLTEHKASKPEYPCTPDESVAFVNYYFKTVKKSLLNFQFRNDLLPELTLANLKSTKVDFENGKEQWDIAIRMANMLESILLNYIENGKIQQPFKKSAFLSKAAAQNLRDKNT